MKPKKPEIVFARVQAGVKAKIRAATDVLGLDPADLIRDAVDEKLARLCAENKAIAKAVRAAA